MALRSTATFCVLNKLSGEKYKVGQRRMQNVLPLQAGCQLQDRLFAIDP
jgi:hypothetical protein